MFNLIELESANARRLPVFKNKRGEIAHPGGIDDWSIAEWTNALAGEAGEACNIAKKIIRGDFEDDPELAIGMLMDELADVVCYADLCAQRIRRHLNTAVVSKFNEVSDRIGCDIKVGLGD